MSSGSCFDPADERHCKEIGEFGMFGERKFGVFAFLLPPYFSVAVWIVAGSLYTKVSTWCFLLLPPDCSDIILCQYPYRQRGCDGILLWPVSECLQLVGPLDSINGHQFSFIKSY